MAMYSPAAADRSILEPRTSSRSATGTVNGSHEFAIKGYSLAKGMGVGNYIASETFTVGGYEWAIYFYPDGKDPNDNGYVSVFIALASEGTCVRTLFELTLLDQSGNGKHKVHNHFHRSLQNGPCTLPCKHSIMGYKRYFKRTRLEASTFLKDDCLKINCTVGVVVSSIDCCSKLNAIQVSESDIAAHFATLLENEEGSDVTFVVDGESFHAHKIVLAARSTTFETQFFNGTEEEDRDRDRDIVVADMEPKVFKAFLHFIYKDTLTEDEELCMSRSAFLPSGSVSESFPAKLLAAAEKYGLPRLKLMCESVLCKYISVDSVAYLLALADRCRATELKSACLQFSAEHRDGKLPIAAIRTARD